MLLSWTAKTRFDFAVPHMLIGALKFYFLNGDGTSSNPYTGNSFFMTIDNATCRDHCTVRSGAFGITVYRYEDPSGPWAGGVLSFGNGADTPNAPDWFLDNIAVDFICSEGKCTEFRVTARIPVSETATTANLSSGLYLPSASSFKFAQDIWVYDYPGAVIDYVEKYFSWPSTSTPSIFDAGSDRPISTFGTVRLGNQQGCHSGVSIQPSEIRINNGSPLNRSGTNTIQATPVNGLTIGVPDSSLLATFKTANCGGSPSSSPSAWMTIPGCADLQTDGYVTTAPGEKFNVECTWAISPSEQCLYAANCPAGCPGGTPASDCRNQSQCVMVELHKNHAATLPEGQFFSSMSAFKTATWQ